MDVPALRRTLGISRNTAKRATARLLRVELIAGSIEEGFRPTEANYDGVAAKLNSPPVRRLRREKLDAKAEHWRRQRDSPDAAVATYHQLRYERRHRAA